MAELVDALDSKSGFRKGVQVRFLFWALDYQSFKKDSLGGSFLFAYNLHTKSTGGIKEL
jgi:hypothetical protein